MIIPNPVDSFALFFGLCTFENRKFSAPMISAAMAAITLRVSMTKALVDTSCRVYTIPHIPVPTAASSRKVFLSTARDRFLSVCTCSV